MRRKSLYPCYLSMIQPMITDNQNGFIQNLVSIFQSTNLIALSIPGEGDVVLSQSLLLTSESFNKKPLNKVFKRMCIKKGFRGIKSLSQKPVLCLERHIMQGRNLPFLQKGTCLNPAFLQNAQCTFLLDSFKLKNVAFPVCTVHTAQCTYFCQIKFH